MICRKIMKLRNRNKTCLVKPLVHGKVRVGPHRQHVPIHHVRLSNSVVSIPLDLLQWLRYVSIKGVAAYLVSVLLFSSCLSPLR